MKQIITICCFLFLTLNNQAKAKNNIYEAISREIEHSISKSIRDSKPYSLNIPSFIKRSTETAENIFVDFPAEEHNNKIIAQVWITTNKGLKLLAVPIRFNNNS